VPRIYESRICNILEKLQKSKIFYFPGYPEGFPKLWERRDARPCVFTSQFILPRRVSQCGRSYQNLFEIYNSRLQCRALLVPRIYESRICNILEKLRKSKIFYFSGYPEGFPKLWERRDARPCVFTSQFIVLQKVFHCSRSKEAERSSLPRPFGEDPLFAGSQCRASLVPGIPESRICNILEKLRKSKIFYFSGYPEGFPKLWESISHFF